MNEWRKKSAETEKQQQQPTGKRKKTKLKEKESLAKITTALNQMEMVFVPLLFSFISWHLIWITRLIVVRTAPPEFAFKRFYCLNYNKVLMCTHITQSASIQTTLCIENQLKGQHKWCHMKVNRACIHLTIYQTRVHLIFVN